MPITKTTTITDIQVISPEGDQAHHQVVVQYKDTWDDPEDNELPLEKFRVETLRRYDTDGNPTDISSHDAMVRSVAELFWTS